MNNFNLRKSDLNRVNLDGHIQSKLLKMSSSDDFNISCRYGTWEVLKEKVKELSPITVSLLVKTITKGDSSVGYYKSQLIDELKLSKDDLLQMASGRRTCDLVIGRLRDHQEKDSLCEEDRKAVMDKAVSTALENGTDEAEDLLSAAIKDMSVVKMINNPKIAKQLAEKEDTPVEILKAIYESATANKDIGTLHNIARNSNEDADVMRMQVEIINAYQDELKKIDLGYGEHFWDLVRELLERHKEIKVVLSV